jgi:hypothetical protein
MWDIKIPVYSEDGARYDNAEDDSNIGDIKLHFKGAHYSPWVLDSKGSPIKDGKRKKGNSKKDKEGKKEEGKGKNDKFESDAGAGNTRSAFTSDQAYFDYWSLTFCFKIKLDL